MNWEMGGPFIYLNSKHHANLIQTEHVIMQAMDFEIYSAAEAIYSFNQQPF